MREFPIAHRASLLVLLLLTGCGAHQGSHSVTAAAPASPASGPAAAADARLGEGPRITLSPDNVHIEYHVYGSGDPAVLLVHGWACDENYWHAPVSYTHLTLPTN